MGSLEQGGRELPSWAAVLVLLLVPASARTETPRVDPTADPRVYLPAAIDVVAVKEALAGARRRLAAASCQGLFTEFADQGGRPLAENLEVLGQTGASYLGLLSFYNGDGKPLCERRQVGVVAFTAPRS